MAGEELAKRILQKELRRTVTINDNGSEDGMYDLRIGPPDAPEVAIECVGAVDPIFTETWNVGPARGPLELSISGDWTIKIAVNARVNIIRQRVERLLRELEARGINNVYVDYRLKRYDLALFNELELLRITHAYCYRPQGTGKVHLGMPGIGGAVDNKGGALPGWVGEFLRDHACKDVLSKLQRSGATDRYAFLLVNFAGAPWAVESYLTGELDQFPSEAPDLPPSVTQVWVVSGFGRRGVRWDGSAWRAFDACGEGIDD